MQNSDFETVVKARRSIRGFLPDVVPQDILDKVFELARWSPSGTNIQPWETFVASGQTRDRLREAFIERARNKIPANPDHISSKKGKMGEPWKQRQRDCAAVLYDSMGVAWEDREARAKVGFRNFEIFDAPHVAFLCMNEHFGIGNAWDVGMYAQTLMLAMTANGLGSCAQGTMRHYPDLVRDAFDLGPEVKVLFGISFGFPDPNMQVNEAKTTRAPLLENVSFRN